MSTEQFVFSVDVESYGLYGNPFAIGVSVRDLATNKEVDSFFAWHPLTAVEGYAEDTRDTKWLHENVLPYLGTAPTHQTPRELRDAFWAFYSKWWARKAVFVADYGVPVEAHLFRLCVQDDLAARNWEGPYPLHELGTRLFDHGQDPIATYDRLPDETPAHHPLFDARQSGRLWIEYSRAPAKADTKTQDSV